MDIVLYLLNLNICSMVIKKFMTITLNFYIIVNKIYLYNYNDKIRYSMIDNELENKK